MRVLVLAGALVLVAAGAGAVTIHVPSDQPTIQAGLDAASASDTVLVACGTYYERDIEMKSGVCLRSETGEPDCVTIDAQQLGRVFYCYGVDSLARIEGFTVTGGLATYPDDLGGGMFCDSSSLALAGCTFSGNQATVGGGMSCDSSSPTLTGCTFSGNQAYYHGGGLFCYLNSNPTLTNCTFSENQASFWGGAMGCGNFSSPTLMGCTFSGNQADQYGGGMICAYYSSPMLMGCTFSGNQATLGGGIFCSEASSSPTLAECIIAFSTQGEAVYCSGEDNTPLLGCCDVYGNAGGDWVGYIADQYGISGNISLDPLFCGDLSPDEPYSLRSDSPCAPENNPECGLIGAWGVGCEVTPVQATRWGAIKAMYR